MNKHAFSKYVKEQTGMTVTELRKELLRQKVPLNDIDNIYLKGLRQDFEKLQQNKETNK
jgi:hypothetical protein